MSEPKRPTACAHIPTLRPCEPRPSDYASTTCFEGGYLTVRNAGWRNVRPVVDTSACTGCLKCYLYCPDGTVFKVAPAPDAPAKATTQIAFDLDFCKGCGVCARECGFGAIRMVDEQAALAREHAADGCASNGSAARPAYSAGRCSDAGKEVRR